MNHTSTKKPTTVGLLCTLAYIATAFGRIPLILFLKYDPKDVIIVIGGLLYGPQTALAVSLIVSVTEMFTISGTGIWGCQVLVMMLWNYLAALFILVSCVLLLLSLGDAF